MVFLHNALCQTQAQAPATLLSGEAGLEDIAQVLLTDTLTRVSDLYGHHIGEIEDPERQRARTAAHGIDSILTQILHYPLKEIGIDVGNGLR